MYLRNSWYVGAWSHELTRKPFQRFLLDEPLVFYRTESGKPVVLDDRCIHRFAPLSAGCLEGDNIVCGYHGFTYAPNGNCIAIPGVDRAPKKAGVKSYPVVEKWGWIWVWMGNEEKADEAKIPDFHYLDDPEWAGKGETLNLKCAYNLVYENLLDLTHAKFVHKTTLATNDVTEFPLEIEEVGDTVVARREMSGIKSSPLFTRAGGFTEPVDHRQHVIFTPPCYISINTTVKSAEASSENKIADIRILNALTPETSKTTNYFWSLVRCFALDDEEMETFLHEANTFAFSEDKAIIEQQQNMWDTVPDAKPIPFPHDKGVIASDRLMRRLMTEE
ncbi:MAG TPA: aromatic ring-hydroxylating dioxygenase subunit alpha [Rhodospirillales bacterium]|jgi:vanillate O-demethylase monooxygenase subunit|nr:aromatic ring-hydroxylating dioxygenase subunit alpha [Rhodospirillales bacterium]HIL76720.1 aromatic ring-hydroxylating dioxygenase subunit alpha [Rhodospirillales bacterium]